MLKQLSRENNVVEDHSSKSKLTNQFTKARFIIFVITIGISLFPCIAQKQNSEKLIPFEQNKKWGFINNKGDVIIQPQFDKAEPFSDGLALVEVDTMDGFIDTKGAYVIKPQYYIAFSFSEGLAAVCKSAESNFGYIDTSGNLVIDHNYFWADSFSEGSAAVRMPDNGKMGYIDKSGNIIIAGKYDRAYLFSDGLGRIEEDGQNSPPNSRRVGFIDKQGTQVIDFFDGAEDFSEGLAAVRVNWKWGFIDMTGDIVIPPVYGLVDSFSEGYTSVECENDKYAFIDKTGAQITNCSFDDTSSFNEGLAGVLLGGKWGYINSKGEFAIKPQYSYGHDFLNGIARVRIIKNDWFYEGYIDRQGKYVIKPTKKEPAKYEEPDFPVLI